MNPDIEKKYQRLRSLFFGLCILAAGILFLSSAHNIYQSSAAAHWPVYKAVVTHELRTGAGYYGGRWLEYTYTVDDKEYRGGRIGFGISRPPQELKNGQFIQVYVNPDDKASAVIVVGIAKSHFIGLIVSAIFMWLGFVIWRRTH